MLKFDVLRYVSTRETITTIKIMEHTHHCQRYLSRPLSKPLLSSVPLYIYETFHWLPIIIDLLVFFFLEFYTNKTIQYVFVWSGSFYLIILRSTHVTAFIKNSFLFIAQWYTILWMNINLFIHLLVDEHWVVSCSWPLQI